MLDERVVEDPCHGGRRRGCGADGEQAGNEVPPLALAVLERSHARKENRRHSNRKQQDDARADAGGCVGTRFLSVEGEPRNEEVAVDESPQGSEPDGRPGIRARRERLSPRAARSFEQRANGKRGDDDRERRRSGKAEHDRPDAASGEADRDAGDESRPREAHVGARERRESPSTLEATPDDGYRERDRHRRGRASERKWVVGARDGRERDGDDGERQEDSRPPCDRRQPSRAGRSARRGCSPRSAVRKPHAPRWPGTPAGGWRPRARPRRVRREGRSRQARGSAPARTGRRRSGRSPHRRRWR